VQEYLLPETADFIQQQLALLAPIRVVIAPGGQDPYTNESPYARLNWPENVDIFYQGKLTHLELAPDIHLWGACNPPARGHKLLEGFQPKNGANILLLHAVQEGNSSEIHSISYEAVQKAGFQCVLLGGNHLANISPSEKPLMIYPGSVEPLSPAEENDQRQVVVLEVNGVNIHAQPLSLRQWHYATVKVDLTNCTSVAEAARRVDAALETTAAKAPQSVVAVTLTGQPPVDMSIAGLQGLLQSPIFYRLEGQFELNYDLEQLAREQTVRGLLVQRFLDRIHKTSNESERRQQLTALNFALQALEGKQVSLYETKTA
jgi:DNA repair exonuclease SbcCD nuclease subunit